MADKIEKTILSVINQTYPHVEYIIIDGGSVDGTVDIIKKYENKLAYWISEPDKGIYNAMNKGIAKATGMYCNFMNVGDHFYDNDVLLNIFAKESRNSDILVGTANTSDYLWVPAKEEIFSLSSIYTICHQASFIKTSLLKTNPYDETLRIVADTKFFIEMLILRNVTYETLPIITCYYEIGGLSSDSIKHQNEMEKVYNELLPKRILIDYKLFKEYNNPIFRTLLPLIKSYPFKRIIIPIFRQLKYTLTKIRHKTN